MALTKKKFHPCPWGGSTEFPLTSGSLWSTVPSTGKITGWRLRHCRYPAGLRFLSVLVGAMSIGLGTTRPCTFTGARRAVGSTAPTWSHWVAARTSPNSPAPDFSLKQTYAKPPCKYLREVHPPALTAPYTPSARGPRTPIFTAFHSSEHELIPATAATNFPPTSGIMRSFLSAW